ncbi:MAG: acyl-CoA thioesterase [Anaerolineales bacterium]
MSNTLNSPLDSKTGQFSRVTLSQLMLPGQANLRGDVHGGWIMKLVDEAGALSAMRHAQCRVVTIAIDQMAFHKPIRIGDLVILNAEVTYVGHTSMETRVQVLAENPISGERTYTNTAYLVYVALDEQGRPIPVPELIAESETEKRRMSEGKKRQEYRLSQRKISEEQRL